MQIRVRDRQFQSVLRCISITRIERHRLDSGCDRSGSHSDDGIAIRDHHHGIHLYPRTKPDSTVAENDTKT